jgi:hypothetical protein
MKNKTFEWLWLSALLLAPFVLWLLPGDVFDNTGIDICPSKLFFDFECYGCGMTRAVMHFHHFQFDDGLYFNQGVLLVYPALMVVWFLWVRSSLNRLGYSFLNFPKSKQA